jgi:hypothetical protein
MANNNLNGKTPDGPGGKEPNQAERARLKGKDYTEAEISEILEPWETSETQLKIIAAEQRRDIQDVLAEALNLIFAKYGKAEIAPRNGRRPATRRVLN